MGRVVIRSIDETPPGSPGALEAVVFRGAIATRDVIAGADRRLRFAVHTLGRDAAIDWQRPAGGHVLYVDQGEIEMDGARLGAGSVAVIEHGAATTTRATADDTRLFHFHAAPGVEHPTRAGGHVHALGPTGLFVAPSPRYDSSAVMWADSGCPTCQLWLHKSIFGTSTPGVGLHHHSEDEIVVVVAGEMVLGGRHARVGTVVAIDAQTRYKFGIGAEGLAFLNFRVTEPRGVRINADGSEGDEIDERKYWNDAWEKSRATAAT